MGKKYDKGITGAISHTSDFKYIFVAGIRLNGNSVDPLEPTILIRDLDLNVIQNLSLDYLDASS